MEQTSVPCSASLFHTSPSNHAGMIKTGYFSVGLPRLTFSRTGETPKTDAVESKNPQKSGSFLSTESVLPLEAAPPPCGQA